MDAQNNDNTPRKVCKASSITMPPQYWEKLAVLCQETGLSVSDHIRRSLDDYFKKENK